MKFKAIEIRNFRNFDDISIYLSNKNVLFGLNDVGKSNFLYALRYVFDRDVRKQNFIDSDFYKKGVDKAIEIIVSIDISEENDTDNEKLRARLKGAMRSGQDTVYIKLRAEYDKKEMIGIPVLYWGGIRTILKK